MLSSTQVEAVGLKVLTEAAATHLIGWLRIITTKKKVVDETKEFREPLCIPAQLLRQTFPRQRRRFNCHSGSFTKIKAIKESRRIRLKRARPSATLITRLTCLEIGTTDGLAAQSRDFFFFFSCTLQFKETLMAVTANKDRQACWQQRCRHIVLVQTPLSRHGVRDAATALILNISEETDKSIEFGSFI